ncbi:retrovirus-related pol polyprotein from transposon TNT 1-94 [Tanacetum coccineum]
MFADLVYVQSLEKEVDELESDKAKFSNEYDLLLQEYVSKDIMCSMFDSLADLVKQNEMQCLYLDKIKECKRLINELSKYKENVSKEVYIELLQISHITSVSRSQLRSTQMKDKVMQNNSQVKLKKIEVKDHHRNFGFSNKTKSITACNDTLKSKTSNVNVVCATCGKYVFNSNHDACVSKFMNDMNARTKKLKVVPISTRKPKIKANKSVATHRKKTVASESTVQNSKSYYRMLYEKTSKAWKWWIEQQCPSGYKWVPKTKMKWVPKVRNETVKKRVSFAIDNASRITNIVQLILFIVDSGCTKHMTGNISILCNFVEKYLGTVRFSNDQFAPILGYGDLVQGNITINKVYYVEGLNHNLFSVGQFCDADLEVAFRKSTCFVRDLQGNDLLTGNRGSDLICNFFILQETTSLNSICLTAQSLTNSSMVMALKTFFILTPISSTCILKKDVVDCLQKDGENLDKMKEKGDPCILVGYSTQSKGYCVYNKRTRLIVESIHLRFDEIKEMSETSVTNDTSSLIQQLLTTELNLLPPSSGPLYDEFFNTSTSRVNKSSSPTDNSTQQDILPSTNIHPTSEPSTPTNVHAEENNDDQAEFTNPFCTPIQEAAESHVNSIHGNPSKLVQTRRQLATDPKMCMFALTVSIVEPKTIKEAMADSAWIEAMQEELH